MLLQGFQVPSPLGALTVVTCGKGLCAIEFDTDQAGMRRQLQRSYAGVPVAWRESGDEGSIGRRLRAYFDGDLMAIDGIDAEARGTPFQRQVWVALRRIPAGRTLSYKELARAVGRPEAVRAVGLANGRNPIAIVVPCHRVIGADGRLTGYGGGLWRKEWLLRHERAEFVAEGAPRTRQRPLPLRLS